MASWDGHAVHLGPCRRHTGVRDGSYGRRRSIWRRAFTATINRWVKRWAAEKDGRLKRRVWSNSRRPDDVQPVSSYHAHLASFPSSRYSSSSSRRRMKSGDDVDGGFDVGRSARPKRYWKVMRPAGTRFQLCSMSMWELEYGKLTWSAVC